MTVSLEAYQHVLARLDHIVAELNMLRADIVGNSSESKPPTAILGVPYRSQWDADASRFASDCGPACAAMILDYYNTNVAIDDIALACGMGTSKNYTLPADLVQVMAKHGIKSQRRLNLTITDLETEVRSNRPTIVLVHYGSLGDLRQDRVFSAGHWMVVVGMTAEAVFVHDPNWRDPRRNEGSGLLIPRDVFEKAWSDCGKDGNTAHQGIVIIPTPMGA